MPVERRERLEHGRRVSPRDGGKALDRECKAGYPGKHRLRRAVRIGQLKHDGVEPLPLFDAGVEFSEPASRQRVQPVERHSGRRGATLRIAYKWQPLRFGWSRPLQRQPSQEAVQRTHIGRLQWIGQPRKQLVEFGDLGIT